MSPRNRHLTWENFRETLLAPGVPAVHSVPGQPRVEIFADEGARRVGLRSAAPTGDAVPASPLALVDIAIRRVGSEKMIEVSTGAQHLYKQFYAMLVDLADRIQLQGKAAAPGIADILQDWKTLLCEISLLSDDEQLGLLGEMWLLERLMLAEGPPGFDSWVGASGEPHDFRRRSVEIEVKATRSTCRTHMVNGLAQLQPSTGHDVAILSLQFQPAGTGDAVSLPEAVDRMRVLLRKDSDRLARFERTLLKLGYRNEDAGNYSERLSLRSMPTLVPVNDCCPRITKKTLDLAIGIRPSERILEVHYRVDLEHLGHEDGSPEFLAVIPRPGDK